MSVRAKRGSGRPAAKPRIVKISAPVDKEAMKRTKKTREDEAAEVGLPPGLPSVTEGKHTRVSVPKELEEKPWDKHPSASQEEEMMDKEEEEEAPGFDLASTDGESESEEQPDSEDDDFIDDSSSDEEEEPDEDDVITRIKVPSSILFQGVKWAGKTELMKKIHEQIGHQYDETFVITQSPDKIGMIASSPAHILPCLTDEFLTDLRAYLDAKKNPPKVLLAMDDFVGIDFNFTASKAWKGWVSSIRNKQGSIWMSSQKFKEMDPLFRDNADYIFVGNNWERQAKHIAEEVSSVRMGTKKVRSVIDSICDENKDDYKQWLFVDRRELYYKKWTAPMPGETQDSANQRRDSQMGGGTKSPKKKRRRVVVEEEEAEASGENE